MTRLMTYGIRQMFGGARRGQPYMAGLGAAITIISYLRSRGQPSTAPIYRRRLREGETLKIRLVRGQMVIDETDVEG